MSLRRCEMNFLGRRAGSLLACDDLAAICPRDFLPFLTRRSVNPLPC